MKPVATLSNHEDRVWSVAWSPSGKVLASSGADRAIRLFAPADANKAPQEWEWVCFAALEDSQSRTIRSLAFHPSGALLAAASFDGTVAVGRRESGGEWEVFATLEGHENEVKCVSWSPNGQLLATCGRDKTVWVWEYSPEGDGSALVGDDEDDEGQAGDQAFECVSVLTGHSQDVKCVRFNPAREELVSCSYDDTIRFWGEDMDDWRCVQELVGVHSNTVWAAAYAPSGNEMASCSQDMSVVVFAFDDAAADAANPGDAAPPATESAVGLVRPAKEWVQRQTLAGAHTRPIFTVDWDPSGLSIATGAGDDAICVFTRPAPGAAFAEKVRIEAAHDSDVNCVQWNPKVPGMLASCGDDGLVKVWRIA